jgi:hypothetical protein
VSAECQHCDYSHVARVVHGVPAQARLGIAVGRAHRLLRPLSRRGSAALPVGFVDGGFHRGTDAGPEVLRAVGF